MMVMIGYPDFLLKPEAINKEYEARDSPGACEDMGTWWGKIVPISASGSVEMPPQNKLLPGAHCAHCWQGAPHQQCHTVPGVWDGVSLPTLQLPELSPILGKGWWCWGGSGTWAQSMGHENTLVTQPYSH